MDIPGSPLAADHRRTNQRAPNVIGLLLFSPAPNRQDFRRCDQGIRFLHALSIAHLVAC